MEVTERILQNFNKVVLGKNVIDPFAGECKIAKWAVKAGAKNVSGFDVLPSVEGVKPADVFNNPPDYSDYDILVTNPPFLAKNRSKGEYAKEFEKFGFDNLYKCFLASITRSGQIPEFICIVPVNFFCEGSDLIRQELFKRYSIEYAEFWNIPPFEESNQCVAIIHCIRQIKQTGQTFPMIIMPEGRPIQMELLPGNGYLHGKEFFEEINKFSNFKDKFRFIKTDEGMDAPNTNIVVSLLDNGKWPGGLSYNEGDPIYCKPSVMSTFQITTKGIELDKETQRIIVEEFNKVFNGFRQKYDSMFLANYMGPNQKIISRRFVNKLLRVIVLRNIYDLQ